MIFRWRGWRCIRNTIFLCLCVLHTDRNTQQFLTRQSQCLQQIRSFINLLVLHIQYLQSYENVRLTSGTDSGSLNSMYAMPLKRFVLLHVIKRTSRTLPTLEKNSCKSRARIRCDNCIQNTVRASKSSSVTSSAGVRLSPSPFGGVLPRRNERGDGVRRLFWGDRLRRRFEGGGGGGGERLRGERLRSRRRSFGRTFLSCVGLRRRSFSLSLDLIDRNHINFNWPF